MSLAHGICGVLRVVNRTRYLCMLIGVGAMFALFNAGSRLDRSVTKCKHDHRNNVDVLDVFLDPETSYRDNFGVLFRSVLRKAGKSKGNFLEIGGGSGEFFNHNMDAFGDAIENYYIIEPFKLFSHNHEPEPEFMRFVNKWKARGEAEPYATKINIVHDYSTNKAVIDSFADKYFDFVFIDGDHSYAGVQKDLTSFYPKVRIGGVLAGHDYCCSSTDAAKIQHAPWCGRYIFPNTTSSPAKHGKPKMSFCGIFQAAEEFSKLHNFQWLYTYEGRYGRDSAGTGNPSYFAIKYDDSTHLKWKGD